jgi:hypothetical protein
MSMTGMPAAEAFWATGSSASGSLGRITSASGFSAISVSTWSACAAESVTPSATLSSTSPSFSASSRAFSVIAAIQP